MSVDNRADYLQAFLEHLYEATTDSLSFVEGLSKDGFLNDKRTQKAVCMNFLIIGETATKLADQYPDFILQHPEIPWRNMRGMRNRIAHGYFSVDLNVIWDTVQTALPALAQVLQTHQTSIDREIQNK
jgi:uncharacterized protein with HEPN domain